MFSFLKVCRAENKSKPTGSRLAAANHNYLALRILSGIGRPVDNTQRPASKVPASSAKAPSGSTGGRETHTQGPSVAQLPQAAGNFRVHQNGKTILRNESAKKRADPGRPTSQPTGAVSRTRLFAIKCTIKYYIIHTHTPRISSSLSRVSISLRRISATQRAGEQNDRPNEH